MYLVWFLVEVKCIHRSVSFRYISLVLWYPLRDEVVVLKYAGNRVVQGKLFLNLTVLYKVDTSFFHSFFVDVRLSLQLGQQIADDAVLSNKKLMSLL